jgi:phosphate/sulfate permease
MPDVITSIFACVILAPMVALVVAAVLVFIRIACRRRTASETAPASEIVQGVTDPSGQAFELRNLKHRAADHSGPDAIVRIANGFDPGAPIHLVVYNHGFYTDIRGGYRDMQLAEQFADVPANVVLMLPEWQRKPGAASGDQGNFATSGIFAGMAQDAFDMVPALRGRTLADVSHIIILGHSAGYGPTETELYNNGIGDKVICVTLLDALYDHYGFDQWLQDNIHALAEGKKRFYNFFFGTAKYSKDQAQSMKKWLSSVGLSPAAVIEDYTHGDSVMDADTVAKYPIVFKFSSVRVDGLEPHFSIPNLYVRAAVLAALRAG